MLGYLIDHYDSTLRERLARFTRGPEHRADAMGEALRGSDSIDSSGSSAKARASRSVARTWPPRHPASRRRRAPAHEGLDEDRLPCGVPGRRHRRLPAPHQADRGRVNRRSTPPAERPISAHPFSDVNDPGEVVETIDRFRGWGLNSVECFYVTHACEQTELIADHCAANGLLTTGSSEFHGPGHRLFSRFRAFSTYGPRQRSGRSPADPGRRPKASSVRPAESIIREAEGLVGPAHGIDPGLPPKTPHPQLRHQPFDELVERILARPHARSASAGHLVGRITPVKPLTFPSRRPLRRAPFRSRRSTPQAAYPRTPRGTRAEFWSSTPRASWRSASYRLITLTIGIVPEFREQARHVRHAADVLGPVDQVEAEVLFGP